MPSITALATTGTSVAPGPDIGGAWVNPDRITADDGSTSNGPNNSGNGTQYLRGTFGGQFDAIPADATIAGIVMEVQLFHTATHATEWANSRVFLVKAGAAAGEDRMAAFPLDDLDIWRPFGAVDDLWGEALTPADVQDAAFGAQIGFAQPAEALGRYRCDAMRMTVHYTDAPTAPVAPGGRRSSG